MTATVKRCNKCKNCKEISADKEPKPCTDKGEQPYNVMTWINIFGKRITKYFK